MRNEKIIRKKTLVMLTSIFITALFLGTVLNPVVAVEPVAISISDRAESLVIKEEVKVEEQFSDAASNEDITEESSDSLPPSEITAKSEESPVCELCSLSSAAEDASQSSYDYLSLEEKETIAKAILILAEHKSLLQGLIDQVKNDNELIVSFVSKYSEVSSDKVAELLRNFDLSAISQDSIEFADYKLIAKSNGEIAVIRDGISAGSFNTIETSQSSGYEIAQYTGMMPTMAMGAVLLGGSGTTDIPPCLQMCYDKAVGLGSAVLNFVKSLIPAAIETFQALWNYWQENKDWLIPLIKEKVKNMLSAAWNAFSTYPGLTLFIAGLSEAVAFAAWSAVAGAIAAAIATGAAILNYPGVALMLAGIIFGVCNFLHHKICGGGSDSTSSATSTSVSTSIQTNINMNTNVNTQMSTGTTGLLVNTQQTTTGNLGL